MNPVRLSSLLSRSRSRIVWDRRNLFVAASALLWGLSGCTLPEEDDPVLPVDPGVSQGRQVRTAFQVRLGNYDDRLGAFLVLDETPNVAGLFKGTLTLSRYGEADSEPVAATLDGENVLNVGAGAIGVAYLWNELRIELRDVDGDGVYESGSGHIDGELDWNWSMNPFSGDFEASPDAFQVAASVHPDGDVLGPLLPWQPLLIEFGQPVRGEYFSSFTVLADGEPVDGNVWFLPSPGHITAVRFTPTAFYPPGSELRVVPVDMPNAVGTPVEIEGAPLPVLPDVGPANVNLGFEQGLTGWSTVGSASVVESYGDVVPVEGAAMAVLTSGRPDDIYNGDSRLIGALDVPADASELDLSLAVLTGEWLPSAVAVRLYREDLFTAPRVFQIYEFGHEAEAYVPCDCADLELTRRSGTFRRQVSLAEFRGERVFIELLLDGNPWVESVPPTDAQALGVLPTPPPPPPVPATVVIDDIQIR